MKFNVYVLWDYISPHKRWARKQIFTPLEWLFDALASRKAELFSALGQISMTFDFSPIFHCFSARTRRSHCTGMTLIVHKLGACTSSTDLKPHVKSVTGSDDDLTQVIEPKSRLNFHQKSLLESHWNKPLEEEITGEAVERGKLCVKEFLSLAAVS